MNSRFACLWLWSGLLFGGILAWGATAWAEETGRQIMEQVVLRHTRPFEYNALILTVSDRSGVEEVRHLRHYARQDGDGMRHRLLVFDDPKPIAGTSFWLRVRAGGKELWALFPAWSHKLKALALGGGGADLLGTDFLTEDVEPPALDAFRFERQEDGVVQGTPCFVVDGYPVVDVKGGEAVSAYSRRRLYVRQDGYAVARADYFDLKGVLWKRRLLLNLQPAIDTRNQHPACFGFFGWATRSCLWVVRTAPKRTLLIVIGLSLFCLQGLPLLHVTNDPITFFKPNALLVQQI